MAEAVVEAADLEVNIQQPLLRKRRELLQPQACPRPSALIQEAGIRVPDHIELEPRTV